MKAPDPGIYQDIPAVEYHAWEACNSSTLKLFRRSPAHALHARLHPPEPSPALEFGSLTHAAVLEPGTFESEYLVAPKVDRRTKAGKATWAEFEETAGARTVVSQGDYDKARAISAAVWGHPLARDLLSSEGLTEVSLVWVDERTGLICKARLDRFATWGGWSSVADLKTAQDASRDGFSRAVAKFGYHIQAAFYLDGLGALSPRPRKFLFVAVEKDPPHAVGVYELDDVDLQQGRSEYRHYLRQWKECGESGIWAGYPTGLQIITLPAWARQLEEEEFNG